MAENLEQTRKSYDLVAGEYVRRLYHELENMPLDCEVLECFARAVRDQGLVCEIGCGPGQVARYLHERGVAVVGLDLSPRMVELACQLNPGIEFQEGDMAKLEAQDASWAGIVAFYSIIHLPRSEVVAVLSEWRRVLHPSGLVLLSFHRGQRSNTQTRCGTTRSRSILPFLSAPRWKAICARRVMWLRSVESEAPTQVSRSRRSAAICWRVSQPEPGFGFRSALRYLRKAESRKSVCRRRRSGSDSKNDTPLGLHPRRNSSSDSKRRLAMTRVCERPEM
jgi:SAM-dependent methyltransferase